MSRYIRGTFLPSVLLLTVLTLLASEAPAQQRSAAALDAEAHLQRTANTYGLEADDLTDMVVTDSYVSKRSGTTHVYLRQQVNGIPVVGGEFTVALDRSGRVFHAAGHGARLSAQRRQSVSRSVSPEAAADALARDAGLAPAGFSVLESKGGRAPVLRLSDGGVAEEPVTAKLVYHRDAAGDLALAWEVGLYELGARHYWLGYVDAATGEVRERHDLVVEDHFGPADAVAEARAASFVPLAEPAAPSLLSALAGSYTVYAFPLESPLWTTPAPPADARTLVADPHDLTASPFGWHDTDGVPGPEFTTTRGNNVEAYTDVDDDNAPDPGSSPNGGAGLVFNFPLDLTQDPSTYRPAAVTNLFYWSNIIHDVMYRYGFDEPSGNFQVNNYGNGGLGSDDVRAEAQDASVLGGGNCNANFFTPPDGNRPRMQMFTCDLATPDSDGDLDAGVIVHEYGHGISTRLTGGPAISCLNNAEQMGEGWSDFYGLLFTMDAADTRTTVRPIGNYLLGQNQSGGGIRSAPYMPSPGAPYTTSFAVNSATYGDTNGSGLPIPHGIGFVWATILWEMTWDLIDAHGFDPDLYNASGTAGNQIAMSLVTEAMKLQPCSPGFVDGRDAIFAADAALYPDGANPGRGLHYETLWQAFARRGLGASASQGSSGTNTDNVEAFDTPLPPPELAYSPTLIAVTLPTGATATETVSLSNIAPAGHEDLNFSVGIVNVTQPFAAPPPPARRASAFGQLTEEEKGDESAAGTGSANLTGGPDAFGYVFIDSDDPTGPAVNFQDISGTGTAITFSSSDDGQATVALPFAFPFYGAPRTSLLVSTNGYVTFGTDGTDFSNDPIPSATEPNALIAPYWDDLHLRSGAAYYGTLPDGRFVIQWSNIGRFEPSTGEDHTFQLLLSEDGAIEVQYATLTTAVPNGHTVGIEDDTAADGLQVAYDAPYAVSNKALRITPPIQWVTASPTGGAIPPGGSDTFDVIFDATGLPNGVYTADLILTTNDPANETVIIPLELTVGEDTTAPVCGPIAFEVNGGHYEIVSSASDDTGIASVTFTRLTANLDGYVDDAGAHGPFAQGDTYLTGDPDPASVGLRARFSVPSGRFTFLVSVADAAGNTALCDPVVTDLAGALPTVTALGASYPNPVRSGAVVTVPFTLAEASDVRVVVYDVLGRAVAVLADESFEAGSYAVSWPESSSLSAGTYVVRFEAGAVTQTQRLTLVR